MITTRVGGIILGGIILGGITFALIGLAPGTLRAQVIGWPFQDFNGNTCGWTGNGGLPVTYDPTQDATGNGGGSAYFTLYYSGTNSGVFTVTVATVDCCGCFAVAILNATNYLSLDFDVKWDNTSAVPLSYFNSPGIQVFANSDSGPQITSFTIPDAATNGWAHVSAPISPYVGSVDFASMIFFKPYTGDGGGTASFWMDNVQLVTRTNLFTLKPVSAPGGAFTLNWNGVVSHFYTVQRSTNLSDWATLATGYPPGGPATTNLSYTDTNPPPGRAFYRVTSP